MLTFTFAKLLYLILALTFKMLCNGFIGFSNMLK